MKQENIKSISLIGPMRLESQAEKDVLSFLGFTESQDGFPISIKIAGKGIHIKKTLQKISIECGKKHQIFRALGILCSQEEECYEIEQKEQFEELSYMMDCSRNAVPRLKTIKEMAVLLAVAGFNQIQLYAEDTMQINGEPYIGTYRGRYTQAQILEYDEYCTCLGIELVPCIQTLAHLNQIFQWKEYHSINDTGDILLIGEERTYQYIENVIKTYSECVKSKKINIGMDEAELVGMGQYYRKHGARNRLDLLTEHLERVLQICLKYGMKPMIWADMVLHFSLIGNPAFKRVVDHKALQKFPSGIRLVYWEYLSADYKGFIETFGYCQEMSQDVGYAGGGWTWTGYAPLYSVGFKSARASLRACKSAKIKNVIYTAWGDDGAEGSVFNPIPLIHYYAEHCYSEGEVDERELSAILEKLYGLSLNDWMRLQSPNVFYDAQKDPRLTAYAKVFMHNDPLLGTFDALVQDDYALGYERRAHELRNAAKKSTKFGYIFENLANLCDVLALKVDWGKKTRAYYLSGDRQRIRAQGELIDEIVHRIKLFLTSFRMQWEKENNSVGFDVMDLRLGGLLQRFENAKHKIERYLSDEIDCIDELEETLEWKTDDLQDDIYVFLRGQRWRTLASNNVI